MTNIRRGAPRWERAALNAVHKPNSRAARLYRARVNTAALLSSASVQRSAYAIMRWNQHGIGGIDPVTGVYTWTRLPSTLDRDYSVCSEYCLFMQIQLETQHTEPERVGEKLREAVDDGRIITLDPRTLARAVRCQVCGTRIERKKS